DLGAGGVMLVVVGDRDGDVAGEAVLAVADGELFASSFLGVAFERVSELGGEPVACSDGVVSVTVGQRVLDLTLGFDGVAGFHDDADAADRSGGQQQRLEQVRSGVDPRPFGDPVGGVHG